MSKQKLLSQESVWQVQPIGNAAIPAESDWMSVDKLPDEIRQKLLTLQNTQGQFIKLPGDDLGISYLSAGIFGILTVIILLPLVFVMTVSELSLAKSLFVFAILFGWLLWLSFIVVRFRRTTNSKLKSFNFITPTQIIRTNYDAVKYRSLLETNSLLLTHYYHQGWMPKEFGPYSRSTLSFKFPQNEFGVWFYDKTEADTSLQKILSWQKYAAEELRKPESKYIENWNIFRGISPQNMRQPKGVFGKIGLAAVFSLVMSCVLTGGFSAVNYLVYSSNTSGKYDEAIKKVKDKQSSAADKEANGVLLQMLENAKQSGDNRITVKFERTVELPKIQISQLENKTPIIPIDDSLSDKMLISKEDEFTIQLATYFDKYFLEKSLFKPLFIDVAKDKNPSANTITISYKIKVNDNKLSVKTGEMSDNATNKTSKFGYFDTASSFTCKVETPNKPAYVFNLSPAVINDYKPSKINESVIYGILFNRAFDKFQADFVKRFDLPQGTN